MGNKNGTPSTKEDKKEVQKPKNEEKITRNMFKFILLGCGESGKSTFFKHVRFLFADPNFVVKEVYIYINQIHSNLIYAINSTYQFMKKQNIEIPGEFDVSIQFLFKYKVFFKDLSQITQISNMDAVASQYFTDDFYENTLKLWKLTQFKDSFYKCKYEYHISDGTEHFFNNLDRLKPNHFKPLTQDFLHCRKKTSTIINMDFSLKIEGVNEYKIKISDVGGDSRERSQWEKAIEKNTIVYVVSTSDYDQKVKGKESENRMMESIKVFDQLVNGIGKERSIIVILNKIDVLKEKLKNSELKNTFSDYEGGGDINKAIGFIQDQFKNQVKDDSKRIHFFQVNSMDKDSINQCFNGILTLLINNEIK